MKNISIVSEFGSNIRFKQQILSNRLHLNPENSEIIAMLTYWGSTNKSIAYLLDYGAVVGFAYVEHYMSKGTFGMYVHPDYRGHGYATELAIVVREVMEDHGYADQPLEVTERALSIFWRVFGDEYPIAKIL